MATLSTLKRTVQKALVDGRVTATEAARIASVAKLGGVNATEKRYLSAAVKAQVDRFDTGAQSRLFSVGARWTAQGNDPAKMAKDGSASYRVSFGKLFVGGVDVRDLKQGAAGDCFFLANAASLARHNPNFLKQSFRANADGTVSVRFFKQAADGSAQPTWVTVDRDTVQRSSRAVYARGADSRELWPALMEKAYARFIGSYEKIGHGGRADLAAFALTGSMGVAKETKSLEAGPLVESLRSAMASHRPVTASTSATESHPGMVPSHSYSVLGVVQTASGPMIRVRNPWGYREPGNVGGDGVFDLSPEAFKARFSWVVV